MTSDKRAITGDFVKIQPEKVSEWFEQAVAFINEIDQIIEGSLG